MHDPVFRRECKKFVKLLITPERIIKHGDQTVVIWADGQKTTVYRSQDDQDNSYAAFTAALSKRLYGSNNALKQAIERSTAQTEKMDRNM